MSGHGGAVAAKHAGEEYQARYFWIEALRMLGRTDVSSVAFEHGNSGKFDDVVVHYRNGHHRSTLPVSRDGSQLKFHVRGNDVIRWSSFTEPTFIGPKSRTTLIEAVVEAYRAHAHGLFTFVTTWHIDGNDTLAEFHRGDDSRFDVGRLFDARRGVLVEQRRSMLALSGADESTLRRALERVVMFPGKGLDAVTRELDAQLSALALEPIGDRLGSRYDGVPFSYLRHGAIDWNAARLREVLRREFGWHQPATSEAQRRRVAVRQFVNFAEHLDDGTDAFLDVVDRFAHRMPIEGEDWNGTIAPRMRDFVRREIEPYHEVELRLATSLSISFLIGASIRPKAPVRLFVEQMSLGRRALWDTAETPAYDGQWATTIIETHATSPDVAVVVSMTHDALDDARTWLAKTDVSVSQVLGFRLATTGHAAIRDASHCASLVQSLVANLPRISPDGTMHLFLSGPAAFAVALGRLAHVVPRVQLYEFDFERRHVERRYFPSILVK